MKVAELMNGCEKLLQKITTLNKFAFSSEECYRLFVLNFDRSFGDVDDEMGVMPSIYAIVDKWLEDLYSL